MKKFLLALLLAISSIASAQAVTINSCSFTTPGADRILFWDDSTSDCGIATPGTGLAFSGTSFTLDNTLQSLSAYNTNGILAQTSADTFTGRTLTGTTNRLSVTNGNGVSGNPTFDIDAAYVGQTSITTLGIVATGTWNATAIGVTRGGTGLTSVAQGDILYGSASNTISALPKNITATRYLSNTGTSNNPAWAQINLANGVTGITPIANGGTNASTESDSIVNLGNPLADAIGEGGQNIFGANFKWIGFNDLEGIAYQIVGSDILGTLSGTFQTLDSDLTALANNSTNGIWVRTGTGTGAARTLTGTTNQIVVTNGNGVSGNPTLSTPQDIHTGASPTFANLTLGTGGAVRTSTSAGNTVLLQAYDVDGVSYTTFGTLTANNTPTFALNSTSIGATTPSTGVFTQVDSDNLRLDANTLSSTDTNGNLFVKPNGTGILALGAGAATNYWSIDSTGLLQANGTAYYGVGLDQAAFKVPGTAAQLNFRFFAGVPGYAFLDTVGSDIASIDVASTDSVVNAVYGYSSGVVSPASIGANQNNYTGFAGGGVVRLTSSGAFNITGAVAPTNSRAQQKYIYNVGANNITLKHQDTNSTAANRFLNTTSADLVLSADQGALCNYDTVTTRWRCNKL